MHLSRQSIVAISIFFSSLFVTTACHLPKQGSLTKGSQTSPASTGKPGYDYLTVLAQRLGQGDFQELRQDTPYCWPRIAEALDTTSNTLSFIPQGGQSDQPLQIRNVLFPAGDPGFEFFRRAVRRALADGLEICTGTVENVRKLRLLKSTATVDGLPVNSYTSTDYQGQRDVVPMAARIYRIRSIVIEQRINSPSWVTYGLLSPEKHLPTDTIYSSSYIGDRLDIDLAPDVAIADFDRLLDALVNQTVVRVRSQAGQTPVVTPVDVNAIGNAANAGSPPVNGAAPSPELSPTTSP